MRKITTFSIHHAMNPHLQTKNRQHFEEIDSTHDYLCSVLSKTNPPAGFCITSAFQSGGRGQIGRSWHSSSGKNLLVSMVFYPHDMVVLRQFDLTIWVTTCLLDVLDKYQLQHLSVKWPNDIYVGEKKIAGILIQNTLRGDLIKNCVISIGLNVNEVDFPDTLPNPTSVKSETGNKTDVETLLTEIRDTLDDHFEKVLFSSRKAEYREIFITKLFGANTYYKYRDAEGQTFNAIIRYVGEDGKLHLQKANGELCSYLFRQVEWLGGNNSTEINESKTI